MGRMAELGMAQRDQATLQVLSSGGQGLQLESDRQRARDVRESFLLEQRELAGLFLAG